MFVDGTLLPTLEAMDVKELRKVITSNCLGRPTSKDKNKLIQTIMTQTEKQCNKGNAFRYDWA
jgi:BarA-like signal transduction histidine kinase